VCTNLITDRLRFTLIFMISITAGPFPPVLDTVFVRSLHLYHNPMVPLAPVPLPRLRHQQSTITVTVVTDLHDAVPDAHAVVVVVVRTGDVRDRLRDAVVAVGGRLRARARRVGQPPGAGLARHHRGRHGRGGGRRAGVQRAGGRRRGVAVRGTAAVREGVTELVVVGGGGVVRPHYPVAATEHTFRKNRCHPRRVHSHLLLSPEALTVSGRVSSSVFSELVMSSSTSMLTALMPHESFWPWSWSSERLVRTKLL
jgi:hypothetical protein